MPFDQGTITFRICRLPQSMPEDAIEKFAALVAPPLEDIQDEPVWGWVSPRHLLDTRIDETTIKFAGHYHLCIRQAERKIPASLLTGRTDPHGGKGRGPSEQKGTPHHQGGRQATPPADDAPPALRRLFRH